MNKYWVLGSGDWSDAENHWATTSGGTPNAANLPTSADDVFFDINSEVEGGTITADNANAYCKDLTSTIVSSWYIYFINNLYVSGSISLDENIYIISLPDMIFDSSNEETILIPLVNSYPSRYQFIGTGKWTLQSDILIPIIYQENGIFDSNGYNITAGQIYFYANTGYTPTVVTSTGIWIPPESEWTLDENNGVKVNIVSEIIEGCTDSTAVNYDPLANMDDGSCQYLPTPINRYFGKDY